MPMPELPEVETLARTLRAATIGKRITKVYLSGVSLRRPVAETLAATLTGRSVRGIRRFGKYLVMELEPKAFWVIHLGMSGTILTGTQTGTSAKHTHAVVKFADRTSLQYRDPRRFGLLAAYEGIKLSQVPEIRSLGKDALSRGFDENYLLPLLKKSRQEIKSFLLDQRKIAGLGNIYACESLFCARIHPGRRCASLTPKESVAAGYLQSRD